MPDPKAIGGLWEMATFSGALPATRTGLEPKVLLGDYHRCASRIREGTHAVAVAGSGREVESSMRQAVDPGSITTIARDNT